MESMCHNSASAGFKDQPTNVGIFILLISTTVNCIFRIYHGA